jgi:hypothetical protein
MGQAIERWKREATMMQWTEKRKMNAASPEGGICKGLVEGLRPDRVQPCENYLLLFRWSMIASLRGSTPAESLFIKEIDRSDC